MKFRYQFFKVWLGVPEYIKYQRSCASFKITQTIIICHNIDDYITVFFERSTFNLIAYWSLSWVEIVVTTNICSCLICIGSLHPAYMFGNLDHCFVYYDNNVKLGNCALFIFLCLVLFFRNGNNLKLVLFCARSHYRDCLCLYVILCLSLISISLSLLLL